MQQLLNALRQPHLAYQEQDRLLHAQVAYQKEFSPTPSAIEELVQQGSFGTQDPPHAKAVTHRVQLVPQVYPTVAPVALGGRR